MNGSHQKSRGISIYDTIVDLNCELIAEEARELYDSDSEFRAAADKLTLEDFRQYCNANSTNQIDTDQPWYVVSKDVLAKLLPALRNAWTRSIGDLETFRPLEFQLENSPAPKPVVMTTEMPTTLAAIPGLDWIDFDEPIFVALSRSKNNKEIAYIRIKKSGQRVTKDNLRKLCVALTHKDGGIAGYIELDPHHPQLSIQLVGEVTTIVIGV